MYTQRPICDRNGGLAQSSGIAEVLDQVMVCSETRALCPLQEPQTEGEWSVCHG